MRTSENTKELFTALIAAQAEMPVISKEDNNTFFGKYAGLPSVVKAIRKLLKKHDLAVIQGGCPIDGDGMGFTISTRLIHKSGQWIEDALPMWVKDANPQKVGSAITYARRYGLCAMLGIVADEDDDANKAAGNRSSAPSAGSSSSNADIGEFL